MPSSRPLPEAVGMPVSVEERRRLGRPMKEGYVPRGESILLLPLTLQQSSPTLKGDRN